MGRIYDKKMRVPPSIRGAMARFAYRAGYHREAGDRPNLKTTRMSDFQQADKAVTEHPAAYRRGQFDYYRMPEHQRW